MPKSVKSETVENEQRIPVEDRPTMKACKLDKPCSQWLPREIPRLRTATRLLRETEVDIDGYCFACSRVGMIRGSKGEINAPYRIQCLSCLQQAKLARAENQLLYQHLAFLPLYLRQSSLLSFNRVNWAASLAPADLQFRADNQELTIRS